MQIRSGFRSRRLLYGALSAAALMTLCAGLSPGHASTPGPTSTVARAAEPAEFVHQEIVNRADGSRMVTWDDRTTTGALAATARHAAYEQRETNQWHFQEQEGEDAWQIRNEKAGSLCLQPAGAPAVGVSVVLRTCEEGNPAQSWRIVKEETDLATGQPGGTSTGWWTLRPDTAPRLAAAVDRVGGNESTISLYRATNSADRLWHHERPWRSW
ncbi:RICIN domain-containing protein [Streptomyces chryseus]|uniref:Ricin B lectin domain-containing protein n=2 Tax=Streptomyces chryseus TaxID=68186 RepID=A0ABQ3DMD6_9ACTN|nr:RICIN domain-containing protein [Streptomyces chryseus]GGX09350.1 hypothetical protein GCM10010353_25960 [Streptomyces chryseus]GHB05909.1 hypothetical protein GCM10010346_31370 [Streptomyces chryseus]